MDCVERDIRSSSDYTVKCELSAEKVVKCNDIEERGQICRDTSEEESAVRLFSQIGEKIYPKLPNN